MDSGETESEGPRSKLSSEVDEDGFREIESGSAKDMVGSTSKELLEELRLKQKKWSLWKTGFTLGFITMVLSTCTGIIPIAIVLLVLGILITPFLWLWDKIRKTTVIMFDFEADAESKYKRLHDAFVEMMKCSKTWHKEAQAEVKTQDRKRSAGASSLARKTEIQLGFSSPDYVKMNIRIPCIPVGKQTLYLLPDQVLVFENSGVGAVSYAQVELKVTGARYIQRETPPRDAKIVDHTWEYVNKDGSPDKRFKENRKLPIALFEQHHFASKTGLNEIVILSRLGPGKDFVEALKGLAQSVAEGRAASCSKCGKLLKPGKDVKFCTKCGASLS
jgi:hypothetical protein